MGIEFVTGDATQPSGDGPKVICHVCNDIGGWGKGFVLALSRRWPEPEASYRAWHAEQGGQPFELGQMQLIEVQEGLWVANMIAQRGIRRGKGPDGEIPLRYDALEACLSTLGEEALRLGASVHMPRIGCGLAGGKWPEVEALVEKQLSGRGVAVTVYDFG